MLAFESDVCPQGEGSLHAFHGNDAKIAGAGSGFGISNPTAVRAVGRGHDSYGPSSPTGQREAAELLILRKRFRRSDPDRQSKRQSDVSESKLGPIAPALQQRALRWWVWCSSIVCQGAQHLIGYRVDKPGPGEGGRRGCFAQSLGTTGTKGQVDDS